MQIKQKFSSSKQPAGGGGGLRHDGFQPIALAGRRLTAELAQLVPRAGLTSAQTDGVIPCGDRTFPPAPLPLKSECPRPLTAPPQPPLKRGKKQAVNIAAHRPFAHEELHVILIL